MKHLFKFKLRTKYSLNDIKKFWQKWLVKKSKFVWRKKTHPSTNIPLLSYRTLEQLQGNKMRIPLKKSGLGLEFTILAYSCGFSNSSILLYTWFTICLWIPQTVPNFANSVSDSVNLSTMDQFWALQCFSYLFVEPKKDQRKAAMMRIPIKIWFWPVAESAHSLQNGQLGLVKLFVISGF